MDYCSCENIRDFPFSKPTTTNHKANDGGLHKVHNDCNGHDKIICDAKDPTIGFFFAGGKKVKFHSKCEVDFKT